jgi:carbamoyl-phosphate synthase large subunit
VKVFVSGGAGVIGKELVKRLLAKGHQIIVGDLQPKPSEFPDTINYLPIDLNYLQVSVECDVFFHLAATFDRLGESADHWESNYQDNVTLSHHLFNVIKAKRIVFASSYLVEPHPRNLTGASKLYTECELEFLKKHKGIDSVCARIYRSYGCGSRDVISRWVRSALKGQEITVHNDQTSLDYIYAGDVAEALIRMAEPHVRGPIPLGYGASIKIKDVVKLIRRLIPNTLVKHTVDQTALETSSCDPRLMQRELKWMPCTSVADGILKIVDYEKRR